MKAAYRIFAQSPHELASMLFGPSWLAGCLHLKTGATFAGLDRAGIPVLIYHAASIDSSQFVSVDAMLSAGNPRSKLMFRSFRRPKPG
jgi:hypothetical protein